MNKVVKNVIQGVAGTLAVAAAYGSFFVVDQTEHAVVTRFGKPKHVVLNPVFDDDSTEMRAAETEKDYAKEGIATSTGPGLYFKIPLLDSVKKIDNRIIQWDGYPEQLPTRDKKYLWVDTSVRGAIEDPLLFYRNVGSEEQMHARLDDVVDGITRNAISRRDLIEIVRSSNRPMQVTETELAESVNVGVIQEGRIVIMGEIAEEAQKVCEQYGFRVLDKGYLIKGLTYVDEVKTKVEERMISERSRLAEKYRSEGRGEAQKINGNRELREKEIVSEAYRKAQAIRGEAEAQAIRTYGEAYGTNPGLYEFMGTLDVYEHLGEHTSVIIGTDSDLFQFLKGPPTVEAESMDTRTE